jgi:hypothetical protein
MRNRRRRIRRERRCKREGKGIEVNEYIDMRKKWNK